MDALIDTVLNLCRAFDNIVTLTILILPVHEQRLCFHFLETPFISFSNDLLFSLYKSLASFIKLISRSLVFLGREYTKLFYFKD